MRDKLQFNEDKMLRSLIKNFVINSTDESVYMK